jgi:monofunctional biosynthetic peptidoglycan transglycosylase
MRLRVDERFDGIAYRAEFDTIEDVWTTVTLPFDTFTPTFRGSVPPNAPALAPSAVRQLGFLIADKREGAFQLEIARVTAASVLVGDDESQPPTPPRNRP